VNAILVLSRPTRPSGEQSQSGDCGRKHERKLDERDRERAAAETAAREQVRQRRPEQEHERLRDQRRLGGHDQRVGDDAARELVEKLPRRNAQEDRRHRQHQERERDNRRHRRQDADDEVAAPHCFLRGRNP